MTSWRVFRKQCIADVMRESTETHASGCGLKKVLGVRDLISIGISSTLGSGIFVTVGSISALAGPGLFLSFLVAAFGSLLSAFCYAEFASRLPVSGQSYTYSYVSLGELVAFTTGWLGFVSYSLATAALTRGWANYVEAICKSLLGNFEMPQWLFSQQIDGFWDLFSLSALAAVLILVCTVLACLGVHESTRISFILVIVNFGLMISFCVYGVVNYGTVKNFDPLLPFGFSGVMKGSGLAFFCCIGWELVCTLGEEVKKPSRDLPRGILGSLAAITVLYSGVCLALSSMVPYADISASAPIDDAFRYHGDHMGSFIVSLTVVIVCIPSTITGIVGPPRLLYKMAVDGLMCGWLRKINSHGAPVYATVICGLLSALLGGVLNFESLASSCSAVTLFMFTIVCIGIVTVRANETTSQLTGNDTALTKLTAALCTFCFVSFAFCICIMESESFTPSVLYTLGFLNVVAGALPIRIYDKIHAGRISSIESTVRGVSSEPLLDNVVVIKAKAASQKDIFMCPLVPVVPIFAAWVNIFMIASLGYAAIGGLVIMLVSGLWVYFTYGIHHSNLGKR